MHKHLSTGCGYNMWEVCVCSCNSFYTRYTHACLYAHACPSVHTCVFVLIMYVCLQRWLRGPDSCSVVWWSSPSGEGAGGWHPPHWPPSGSPALLYSLPTSHIPALNHAVSPCLSPPHTTAHTTQSSGHAECKIIYTSPPPPQPKAGTLKRIHKGAHTDRQIQWRESTPSSDRNKANRAWTQKTPHDRMCANFTHQAWSSPNDWLSMYLHYVILKQKYLCLYLTVCYHNANTSPKKGNSAGGGIEEVK